jgi:predicted DNA-binding transcriptional regulator YafY
MARIESLTRLNFIINFLKKKPATFQQIADYLEKMSELEERDYNISIRTLQRDIKAIQASFNIEIKNNRQNNTYYIENNHDLNGAQQLLEAFDTLNVLNTAASASQYILFERRNPRGTENLYPLLTAIQNRKKVSFIYQKFYDDKESIRNVAPYALREFKSRWYLVARDGKDGIIKTFGLDRLREPSMLNENFTYPEKEELNRKFNYCFGVITPDTGEPEEIVLSFTPFQAKYIKTMPLHHTQEVVEDNAKECIISLFLFNTLDFRMELLSYGKEVKVLKPKALANQIKKMHDEAAKVKG